VRTASPRTILPLHLTTATSPIFTVSMVSMTYSSLTDIYANRRRKVSDVTSNDVNRCKQTL
jgi:hypothetical protein